MSASWSSVSPFGPIGAARPCCIERRLAAQRAPRAWCPARGCSSRSSATEPSSVLARRTATLAKRLPSIARAAFCWLCEREAVDVLAREALARRDQVGRDALRHDGCSALAQLLVEAVEHRRRRCPSARATSTRRRRRSPASMLPGHDALRGDELTACETRAAEAVERDAGGSARASPPRARVARDARALLADLRDAARRRRPRRRPGRSRCACAALQRLREQLLRVDAREPALARLAAAARGTNCVDDPCLCCHDSTSV